MRSAKNKSTVTMSDVAQRASVSQTTVSYVLNDRLHGVNIPLLTRQRVLDAARDLGYRRNQLARAMVTGKSRILGVFTNSAASEEHTEATMRIMVGAMEAANENGYLLKAIQLPYSGINDQIVAQYAEWQISGAMAIGLSEVNQERLYQELRVKDIPLVMVDNAPKITAGVAIISDDKTGIRLVVEHLRMLGHRRIAYVGGRPGNLTTRREQMFREVMAEFGLPLPEHWVHNTSWNLQPVIEEGVRRVLCAGSVRPTAIVCSGDNIAMVVLRVADALGLRTPEDLSVTGYSDANLSSFATPPLTTVDQFFNKMGRAATEYLVDWDQKTEEEKRSKMLLKQEILIPTRLVVRNSTAAPPLEAS